MMRKRIFVISCTLCFIAGLATAILTQDFLPSNALGRTTSVVSVISSNEFRAANHNLKAWGDLDSLEIPLAESENLFPDREIRLRPPHWFFQNLSRADVEGLLNSASLPPDQKTQLLSDSIFQIASNGCFVSPPMSIVRTLSSSSRRIIYEMLAKSTNNYAQCFPFRFTFGGFSARFERSGLAPEKIELLRELTYTNNGTICFADIELLPEILSQTEFNQAIEGFYRYPAYRLRLRVYPDSDINALVKYWGKGVMEKRVRPLLESLAKVQRENGTSMNVSAFFPPFARSRLFTFPGSWSEPEASREDCIWSCMNFFNEQPDMRLLDSSHSRDILLKEFAMIHDQPTYGDLVCLMNDRGDLIHMCVYLAENFVFTKNGINQLQPWVIMKMPDMLLFFPSEKQHQFAVFRRKEAESSSLH